MFNYKILVWGAKSKTLILLNMIKNNLIFKEITSCTDDQIKKIRDLRNLENVRKFMYKRI